MLLLLLLLLLPLILQGQSKRMFSPERVIKLNLLGLEQLLPAAESKRLRPRITTELRLIDRCLFHGS